MSNSKFGDYTLFDLIGEQTEWIYMMAPAQEERNKICEGEGKCPGPNSLKSEWAVNLAGSKWYFFLKKYLHIIRQL